MKIFYDCLLTAFISSGILAMFWVCATLHEISISLQSLCKLLTNPRLEIPSPVRVTIENLTTAAGGVE